MTILMTNNKILKLLMTAHKLHDKDVRAILLLVGLDVRENLLKDYLYSEDNPKYKNCSNRVLEGFLKGLVVYLRGRKFSITKDGVVLDELIDRFNKELKEIMSKDA